MVALACAAPAPAACPCRAVAARRQRGPAAPALHRSGSIVAVHASSSSSSASSAGHQAAAAATPSRRRAVLGAAAAAALGSLLSLPQPASADVPKAYEDTAVKLVAALREAISTDLSDAEERQVRRAADPAKTLVREFLGRWKGNPAVAGEASYAQLTSAITQLGAFYQANGQRSRLTPEAGQSILDALDAAEGALPEQQPTRSLLPFF